MIVRTLREAETTERRVVTANWESTRLLLKADGMGYSLHITTVYAGTTTEMEYTNHFEAVYCIAGQGEIESVADGTIHPIEPGTMYALDKHDRHIVRATTELKLICVFNPPVSGREVHDDKGAFPLEG